MTEINLSYIWSLPWGLGSQLSNPLEFSKESTQGVSCYVNEVTIELHEGWGLVAKSSQLYS